MKRKSITKVVFCLFLILLFSFSYSQNNIEKKIYNTKATTSPPAIDGLENDVCWKTVEWSSDFIQFRSNLVVRWEYLPGSTLYLVWSQGRTSSDINGLFSYGNDVKDLFKIVPHNIFLLKFSYWFSL